MNIDIWSWSDEKMTEYLREWADIRCLKIPIDWKPTERLADVWLCVNEIAYLRPHVQGRVTRDEGVNFSNTMYENHGDLWNGCEENDAARRIACSLIYAIENARLGEIV